MIKNIIFDMGNVLIKFDPHMFIKREGITDSGTTSFLMEKIFLSKYWPMMDSGDLNEDRMEAIVLPTIPENLRNVAHRLISCWYDRLIPIPGMAEFVKECKDAGFGIYLLSNASPSQKLYWHSIPGSEYFDGTIVSSDIRMVKPDSCIYNFLLKKFDLKANECIFFDDIKENVLGAESCGIHAVQFAGDIGVLKKSVGLI